MGTWTRTRLASRWVCTRHRHRRRRRRRARARDAAGRQARPAREGARHARRPLAHAPVEAAAARVRRGQHGSRPPRARLPGAGALAPLPLPAGRDGRARPRRGGSSRSRRTLDEDGRELIPRREIPYDTLVIAVGSHTNDFGTPGAREHAISLDRARPGGALPPAAHQRLHPRQLAGRAAPARAAQRRDHRRRRHRRRARGRAAQDHARARRLRPRPHRPREGREAHGHRGGAAHPAGAARAPVEGRPRSCCAGLNVQVLTGERVTRSEGGRRRRPPAARRFRPS